MSSAYTTERTATLAERTVTGIFHSQDLRRMVEYHTGQLQQTIRQRSEFLAVRGITAAGIAPAESVEPPAILERPETLRLTKREMQVLQCLADGQSSKELAHSLGIKFKTAVCHRSNIMQKFDVHETASLVRKAIRYGFVQA